MYVKLVNSRLVSTLFQATSSSIANEMVGSKIGWMQAVIDSNRG
jgi:hypothetical protein